MPRLLLCDDSSPFICKFSSHHSAGDHLMRRITTFLGLATAVLAVSIGSSFAQSGRTQVGVLECRGGPNIGMVVGSVTNLGCVFRSQGRPDDLYTAQVTKLGLDIGITDQTVLSWAV